MDISLSADALDAAFHPGEQENVLAVGLISGKVQLYDYTALAETEPDDVEAAEDKLYKRLWSVRTSHKSCRGVSFDTTGTQLYTISKDRSLLVVDPRTGQVTTRLSNAHE